MPGSCVTTYARLIAKQFTYRYYIDLAQNVRATWMGSCIPYFTAVFLMISSLVHYFNNFHSVQIRR